MDIKYEEYLDRGTKRIMDLFSSEDISAEERNNIVCAFTDELSGNIADTKGLRNSDLLINSASVRFIDEEISRILSKENTSFTEYEDGINYCARQQQLFSLFRKNEWKLPAVENSNPERCIELFHKRQETQSVVSKILYEDKRIDELITQAEDELSAGLCEQVIELINELEQDLSFCKQKQIPVPQINNEDTRIAFERATEIWKKAEQKESVYKEIRNTDNQINMFVDNPALTQEQCQKIISLCRKQTELFLECNRRIWVIPSVQYEVPEKIIEQYRHYIKMLDQDDVIDSKRESLSTVREYNEFYGYCDTQKKNISYCLLKGWNIPHLKYPEPKALIDAVRAEKSRKDKRREMKKKLVLRGFGLIIILTLVITGIRMYNAGRAKAPFDASYVIGQEQNVIYEELESAGFKSIIMKQDDSGWQKENEVVRVTIDNSDNYVKGTSFKAEAGVEITYSSENRVYVTDLLSDWEKKQYTVIEKSLKDAGFTNITIKKVTTTDKQINGLTASISLDGVFYTNEHCYLSKKAPIVISFYSLKVGIGNNNDHFIGQDFEKVVASLKESGFTNVHTQKITTGFARGNTVVGVTVNNVDTYNSSELFDPGVKIVVKYSSNDRYDITEILKNWQSTDFEQLVSELKKKGFPTIDVTPKLTEKKTQNRLVSRITLDNQEYIAGECHLSKDAAIKIEYYNLQIKIGQIAEQFENNQFIGQEFEKVVASLKESGFTNVHTEEITTGFARGNTVVGVTVNNADTYNSNELFDPDVKIIVKYSSNDRYDITEILENWQNTDYEKIFSELKKKGFPAIEVTSEETRNINKNQMVSRIMLNNQEYKSGECHISKDASINIEYYNLMIAIGQTAEQFEKNQMYKDVVEELRDKGFTNIHLQRADNIGWFPIHDKEGTIKSFTINGTKDFTVDDSFSYDVEIVIVVNTRKGKGCEDIIEIAK